MAARPRIWFIERFDWRHGASFEFHEFDSTVRLGAGAFPTAQHHQEALILEAHHDEISDLTTSMFLTSLNTIVALIVFSQSNVAKAWVNLDVRSGAATRTLPVRRRHRHHIIFSPVVVGMSPSAMGGHPETGNTICSIDHSMRPPSFRGRRRWRTSVALACARTTPKHSVIGGTFVEGDDYESSLEEIEAMGGDPSFLGACTAPPGEGSSVESATSEGESLGWNVEADEGWNGVADDNAHFDFD
jgi:hypothetical protein